METPKSPLEKHEESVPLTPAPGGIPAASSSAVETNSEAKTFGMLCHLGALAGFVIPFGNIVGPLIFWLLKKDAHPFVDDQGKESLNFQITVIFAMIVSAILILVVIGIFLMIAVAITSLILIIIATIKANEGVAYRYPFALRLIK